MFGWFLTLFAGLAALLLLYFNTVATVITVKEASLTLGTKMTRSLVVWLLPFVGFAFILRFSQQAEESELHTRLVPRLVRGWLYDASAHRANPLRDDGEFKALTGFPTFGHGRQGED